MAKLWPKQKHEFKKKGSISPKTQHFLYKNFSSIEDHNQTKQPFQTKILYKKRYSKPQNKYPYTYPYKNLYKQFHINPYKFHTLIYVSFLLPSSFFSSFLLLLLLLLFSSPLSVFCPIPKDQKIFLALR